MARPSPRSLRKQLLFIIGLAVAAITVFGSFFFMITLNILQSKEDNYINNAIQQILSNISDSSDRISKYALQISQNHFTQLFLQSSNDASKYEYSNILSDIIPTITERIDDDFNVVIVDLNGNMLGFKRKFYSVIDKLESEYDAFSPVVMTSAYTSSIYNTLTQSNYYAYFTPILNNRVGSKINDKIGTLVIMISIKDISTNLQQIKMTPNSLLMVVDKNDTVLASSNADEMTAKAVIQKNGTVSSDDSLTKTEGMILGKQYMIHSCMMPDTGWRIISVVPISDINIELSQLLFYSIVFFALILIIMMFLYIRIMHSITNPIAKIAAFVEKGPHYNLKNRLVLKDKNEIGVLEKHINQMLDEISQMTDMVIAGQKTMFETELARKQAELSTLQSQINPHFLYNTLDCIKGYGYVLNSREIIEITSALSAIMRYCIKGPDMATVEEEINNIKKYMSIISIRFNNQVKYQIDIPAEIYTMDIPRLLLQPVVENAVYHGLEPKPSKGTVFINAIVDEFRRIVFQITDDGVGMKPYELDKLKSSLCNETSVNLKNTGFVSPGIGLININNRIRIKYGEPYGLTIGSEENIRTTVTIVIPSSHTQYRIDNNAT